MRTRHLDAWAKGKTPLLVAACQNIATSADACFAMMCADRGEAPNLDKLWPIPAAGDDNRLDPSAGAFLFVRGSSRGDYGGDVRRGPVIPRQNACRS